MPSITTDFQEKLSKSSGIGRSAHHPGFLCEPFDLSMKAARAEAEMVMFDLVEKLLDSKNLVATDLDILIVNCSLFCPTPSLAAMVMHKFKMRSDLLSFNLGGMGCSAGLIALDLAKRLLLLHPNFLALVISTENLTQNMYFGLEKEMMVQNALFRVGGAAILLGGDRSVRRLQGANYFRIKHVERTNACKDDESFYCVYEDEDKEGFRGVRLSKSVMRVAATVLRANITKIGPYILSYAEQMKYVLNLAANTLLNRSLPKSIPLFIASTFYSIGDFFFSPPPMNGISIWNSFRISCHRFFAQACSVPLLAPPEPTGEQSGASSIPVEVASTSNQYLPNFEAAVDHICIHAGGRAVLDAIEKKLNLSIQKMEPARCALFKFGNTSSSSVWYQLDFIRQNYVLQRGQVIWQIAFGSGFKCNSSILQVQ